MSFGNSICDMCKEKEQITLIWDSVAYCKKCEKIEKQKWREQEIKDAGGLTKQEVKEAIDNIYLKISKEEYDAYGLIISFRRKLKKELGLDEE